MKWTVAGVDDFTTDLRSRGRFLSALRDYHGGIRSFCD